MAEATTFSKLKRMRRVYVFSIPVRIYHWVNALCIVVLIATGLIIGDPPAIMSGSEASFSYWFGTVRFLHFLFAMIFVFNFLFRIYWGFVGNRFETWRNFIPTNKEFLREMWDVIRFDVLLKPKITHVSVGHNALAGFSYFIFFLVSLAMIFTGFALYSSMTTWWLPKMFTWVIPIFGGDFGVRFIHHLLMWFFVIFSMVHIYLVLYHDYLEGRGEISSMGGGWKFLEEDYVDKQESHVN